MTTTLAPSPPHAKRAKVGDKLGLMFFDNEDDRDAATGLGYVERADYEVLKVYDDGRLRVSHEGSTCVLKPHGSKHRRLCWRHTRRGGSARFRYWDVVIQIPRDIEIADAINADYEAEQASEEAAREAQYERNRPMYERIIAFADRHDLILGSSMDLRPRSSFKYVATHARIDQLMPYTDAAVDLDGYSIELPLALVDLNG